MVESTLEPDKNQKENQPAAGRGKKTNWLLIILFALSLGGNLWLYWMYHNKATEVEVVYVEKDNLMNAKDSLDNELQELLMKYDTMTTSNAEMKTKIEAQKEKIQEMMKEAEKHKDDAWIIHKLRKETKTLRGIMKGYVYTIDSLNTLNIRLREEKEQINVKLTQQTNVNKELKKENQGLGEKVKIGSKLEALNLEAVAQKVRSNGIHKATTHSEKAEKIRVCFTLSRNDIAKSGEKWLYVRIIKPDGEVLCLNKDESNMFTYEGIKGQYSIKKQVIYDNEELDVCTYWDVVDLLPAGTFQILVYADEMEIGHSTLTLK